MIVPAGAPTFKEALRWGAEIFHTLKKILKKLKSESGNLTVKENIKHKTGNFDDENYLSGVTLTSNEVTYDAEDLTARELSFNAEAMKEIVDGEEIQ